VAIVCRASGAAPADGPTGRSGPAAGGRRQRPARRKGLGNGGASCGAATNNIAKGLNHSARRWGAGAPCASTYAGKLRKTDITLSGLNDLFGRPPRVVPRLSGADQPWAE